MSDGPLRPPRPDEEDLIRFHNGDTLDNIPIIHPPVPAPVPEPMRLQSRLALAGASVLVAAVSGLAVAGSLQFTESGQDRTDARPPAEPVAVGTTPASPSPPVAPPESTQPAGPTPDEAVTMAAQPRLEQVRVIQAPATGGDPGVAYCLVYTGSDSSGVKDAILLANAPAYQCADLLPYDEYAGSFSSEPPSCQQPARAAVLSFAGTSEWAGTVTFTCLTRHTGA
ncbi:hypothetical protein ACI2L1_04850 [Streptomyces sp. NPDC019531]|uniref:hypothetical protein n=1 Tax=Streptomyces sp. NPDC019531 TaxID=3365062 RepID=UPI00384F01A3